MNTETSPIGPISLGWIVQQLDEAARDIWRKFFEDPPEPNIRKAHIYRLSQHYWPLIEHIAKCIAQKHAHVVSAFEEACNEGFLVLQDQLQTWAQDAAFAKTRMTSLIKAMLRAIKPNRKMELVDGQAILIVLDEHLDDTWPSNEDEIILPEDEEEGT